MRRSEDDNFGLSFLDAITCGFGAIILLFVLTASSDQNLRDDETSELRGEVNTFDEELLEGQENLAVLRNTLLETEDKIITANGLANEVIKETQNLDAETSRLDKETIATIEHINELMADIEAKKEALKARQGSTRVDPGQDLLRRQGNNRQQYLTGLKTDGRRMVILLDRSLSMTAEKLPEILGLRSASNAKKQSQEKWQRALEATKWLLSTMSNADFFQVYTYSETTEPVMEGPGNQWLPTNSQNLTRVTALLDQVVPEGGTNLERAFRQIRNLSPAPDNVIVLTDGLPTRGDSAALPSSQVSGSDRLRALEMAEQAIPSNVPVNVILFYLEGDPDASSSYWSLASRHGGSFFSPAESWP